MSVAQIIEYLGSDWTQMKALIRSSLSTNVALLDDTNSGILSHSGKMLRPLISLLLAKAISEPTEASRHYAAAVELLHNATLMHDDVADNSSKRRGAPTVSALLGPSAAVLVGDFWLARAVQLVLEAKGSDKVLGLFTKTLNDLAEGELLQMEKAESGDTAEEDYYRIIRCKTATLFEISGAAAASSVGAEDEVYEAARNFALLFGIAFQIKDDILDYVGTDELGKPTGVDLNEQKITLPLLGVLKGSSREAEMREKIRNIHANPQYCEEIRQFVVDGGGVEYAAERLKEYVEKAISALSILPDSPAKTYLTEIAEFNLLREV